MVEKKSPWSAFLIGVIGFLLSALVGILTGFLFFRLGIFRLLINLTPEGQPLVRLFTAIVLAFLGVGLAGAAYGLLCGQTLHRIDPQGSRRRYLLGGAFAYGISYAILLIPLLLLTALFARYNQGSSRDPFSFMALFTLLGTIYGLLSGLVLTLTTVKVRYLWLPLFASLLGGALGGMLLGLLIWRHVRTLALASPQLQLIVFFLYVALALAGLVGGFLGLAYQGVMRKRAGTAEVKIEPSRRQDILILLAGGLLLVTAVILTNTLVEFVTVHTGTTTTSLGSETEGIGWSEPFPLTENILLTEDAAPDLEAGPQGNLVAAWTFDRGGKAEVSYAYLEEYQAETAGWSRPVNVSSSEGSDSVHQQLAISRDGSIHIIWSEEINPDRQEIRYSRCQGDSCTHPQTLSTTAETCREQPFPGQQDWPAIAVGENGSLAVAWNAGGLLAYTIVRSGDEPTASQVRCFQPVQGANPTLQPRLAPAEAGQFALVYGIGSFAGNAGIHLVEVSPNGPGMDAEIGQGHSPEIYRDQEGQLHLAWCGSDDALNTLLMGGAVEKIQYPPCTNRPGILKDAQGEMHLVWYSGQVQDNFGNQRPGNFIYESIRIDGAWSQPAIVAQLARPESLSATSRPDAGLFILWGDASGNTPRLLLAHQPLYRCAPESLTPTGLAVLQVIQDGEYHPDGYKSPYCNNQFKSFIFMPGPKPVFSSQPATPNGGFDLLKEYIQNTRYELLLSNMMWEPDQDELSPGFQVIEGIATLYKLIHANPSAYPRGLTVRILLGNYPNISTFQYGDQIWNVIDDLRKAGVAKLEDPAIGWKLEVANFGGSYPHSHTKFIVVDGRSLMAAGFNISWLHYPYEHPSGKGNDLTDIGMHIQGPVAQPAMVDFDDEWQGGDQLVCSDLMIGEDSDRWQKSCEWKTAAVSHVPEVLKYQPVSPGSTAFALYRTDVYKEADRAYDAALASAKSSIDAIHVNFSAEMICLLNLIAPDACTFNNALPWMKAVVEAIQKNHVHVRVIVENANMNGLENRVGIDLLEKELDRLGLNDFVEIRFFDGRLHMKTVLIDHQLLIAGSQNFHYSSFSPGGLLEFGAATEDKAAIQTYEEMFNYYWGQAIPADEAPWGTTGE